MEPLLARLEKEELRELLTKGWMTHDAMWLFHCLQECGIEQTNRINIAAVRSMAEIEIRRIKKAMGLDKKPIETFEELADLLENAFSFIKADFMKFSFDRPAKNILAWEWDAGKCFAYEGISKLGMLDQYECGIMQRIEGWLKGLGVEYTMTPEIKGCLMHETGGCSGEFRFNFN